MKKTIAMITGDTPAELLDWERMKQGGLFGVAISAGMADYNGGITPHAFAAPCICGAAESGLRIGLMIEARCKTPFAAHAAARNAAAMADGWGIKPQLPTAFALSERRLGCLIGQGRDGLTDTALAFLFETRRAGGGAVIYTDSAFAESYLDTGRLKGGCIWISGPERGNLGGRACIRGLSAGEEGYIPGLGGLAQSVILAYN